ncbi:MAG: GLPGLI family protein [Chitinophagaceae bacterium]|nr:GLPGLI family protein [Chitinophagaceae bacterium]
MKTRIYFLAFALFSFCFTKAQQFINKAVIVYEVKSNIKKTMGNNMWDDMLKENMPQFKTGYYNFTFANNKSIYKFDHWDEKSKMPEFMRKSDEENVWYTDYNTGTFAMQKNVWGSNFNVEDSIPALQWKLTNENRVIAGFNCRKAVAKMFDSVYVYAFYTDEITISGGPCTINGLPGMILGVTIPRLYTSWIATKIMLSSVPENSIKAVDAKKNYSMIWLKKTLVDRTKDWYSEDEDNKDDNRQQKNRFIWTTML